MLPFKNTLRAILFYVLGIVTTVFGLGFSGIKNWIFSILVLLMIFNFCGLSIYFRNNPQIFKRVIWTHIVMSTLVILFLVNIVLNQLEFAYGAYKNIRLGFVRSSRSNL